jgi:hypothetical protein
MLVEQEFCPSVSCWKVDEIGDVVSATGGEVKMDGPELGVLGFAVAVVVMLRRDFDAVVGHPRALNA